LDIALVLGEGNVVKKIFITKYAVGNIQYSQTTMY